MPTQNPAQASRVHRWGYACGMSIKRGYRKLKTFEARVAERAVTAGKLLVRGGFLIVRLALIGGLLFVGFWLIASLVMMIAVIVLLQSKAVIDMDIKEENPGPDYLGANSYLGNYDDNGHYIGHFKSSSDVK